MAEDITYGTSLFPFLSRNTNCHALDVLKFEYMTQLLLDSNYLPLVLKLFALHDIQQVVESKTDGIESR